MRHVGLVAAAIAAATALSSKRGKEYLNSQLEPIFMPAEQSETSNGEANRHYRERVYR
jgi:hypothetical protein